MFFLWFLPCALLLFAGVAIVAAGERKLRGVLLLSVLYIFSKLLYGFQMSALPAGTSSVSVLILAMVLVAAVQLPAMRLRTLFAKPGLAAGAMTRVTTAVGMLTEAFAAAQSLLFYALVQPMQLAVLLVTALIRRERLSRDRLVGSVVTLVAVCATALAIYFWGRGV